MSRKTMGGGAQTSARQPLTLTSLSSAEEVGDSEQPGAGRVPVRGAGALLGEAVLPPPADAGTEFQPALDVVMETQSGADEYGIRQRAQEGGEDPSAP